MKDLVSILDGNTFLVSDRRGDIEPSFAFPTGLFSFDTRFLSTWVLTLNGERLHALSVDDSESYRTTFFLAPGEPTHYLDAKASVIRSRAIGGSFDEELTVLNHSGEEVDFSVRLEMSSDFADLFEIKHAREKIGRTTVAVTDNELRLTYRREAFHRETVVRSTVPAQVDASGMTFQVRIQSNSEWTTRLHVSTVVYGARGEDIRATLPYAGSRGGDAIRAEQQELIDRAPKLGCDCEPLAGAYRRSLNDLAALRYESIALGVRLIAAGLPWFMTLFGRDSIITSLQVLPFLPELIPPTILMLAGLQGHRVDDFRDEEPGKILHELRYGETAGFEEQPHSPYYGSADSTPLFVILIDEYERWTGDTALVKRLEPHVRAALEWIDTYGDLLGTGYLWYRTRQPGDRVAEPVLEGLLGRHLVRRRPDAGLPPGHLRVAGLRVRREDPGSPAGPEGLERPGVRRPVGAGGCGAQAAVQPRLLDRRPGVLCARPGRRRPAGGRADVEHRAPAVERDRGRVPGRQGGRPPARAAALLRLGGADPRRG
ncbi:Conserved hypothetical protein [Micromonospora lupini str. Lupac 08]|uniref:Putative glycogen debranching enzyme N-terminal domain-containing protein n=1 Tax=Micromonospora lupini str. Lupac 08 TaxID=1150864 RepID=I0LCU0_9ACTN|nr:Conserved hypothetical protein [Micromonospora lupini str. Lupac 08]